MLNPTKYIRQGVVNTLRGFGITEPIYEGRVPRGVNPPPTSYILLTSPTLNQFAVSKDDKEWQPTINVDVNKVNPQGFNSGNSLDDLVERIMNALEQINVPNFIVKNKNHALQNMVDLPLETDTASIQRRVLTYQFWVNNVD